MACDTVKLAPNDDRDQLLKSEYPRLTSYYDSEIS